MQNEPVDNEAPQAVTPGRSARLREMRRRLAAQLGVDPAVVDRACQRAEDRTVAPRRSLLVLALADNQRQLNRLHGEQAELHARALEMGLRSDELAGTSSPASEVRSLASEIGAVSGRSQRSVQIEFGRADAMANVFEPVRAAMEAGTISRAHALVIVDAGLRIGHPDPAELERRRAEFCRVVLEKAASTTPGRIRSLAERAAEELTEVSLDERFEQARRTRRVALAQLDDGLGELSVIDSFAKLRLIYDRATRQARFISDAERRAAREWAAAEARAGDADADAGAGAGTGAEADADAPPFARSGPRSLDEVRADVLSDSFLRATPEELKGRDPIKAKISLTIPAETLLAPGAPPTRAPRIAEHPGEPGEPGEPNDTGEPTQTGKSGSIGDPPPQFSSAPALLDGHIPVPAAEVRRLIDAAPELERIFTDPIKGTLVEVDSYRPTSAMRRRLAVRDGRCRFVGCMMPANRCDIDHTKAWEEGGPTSLTNLGHLCGSDHTGKHHGDWAVKQSPDGVYEWRSPTGAVVRDEPVQFGRLTSMPRPAVTADVQGGAPDVPSDEPTYPEVREHSDWRDAERRTRFPKLGFLEEFKRERAAKKAAMESKASGRSDTSATPTASGNGNGNGNGNGPTFRPTEGNSDQRKGSRGEPRNPPEGAEPSRDPPPF